MLEKWIAKRKYIKKLEADIKMLETERDDAVIRNKQLRDALEEYGQHSRRCYSECSEIAAPADYNPLLSCDCGLAKYAEK